VLSKPIEDDCLNIFHRDGPTRSCGSFLPTIGFTCFDMSLQGDGGRAGFHVVDRHPGWLEWLIIQNMNANKIGFTIASGFPALVDPEVLEMEALQLQRRAVAVA
jgi:hypothetical protein